MKNVRILIAIIAIILLCLLAILYPSFTGKELGCRNHKNSSMSDDITICSFGDEFFVMKDNRSPGFQEKVSLLANVSANAEKDLAYYDYPGGPLLGVGYSKDEVIVSVYRNWTVNETIIREMCSVVERHGDLAGIRRIPCRVISMGPLVLESSDNHLIGLKDLDVRTNPLIDEWLLVSEDSDWHTPSEAYSYQRLIENHPGQMLYVSTTGTFLSNGHLSTTSRIQGTTP